MTPLFESLPIWVTGPTIIIGVALLSVWASIQVRKRHALEDLIQNNEIAGFKFGVIGVLYAVVLGMAVVAVWTNFQDASETALNEASTVGDMYRDASGLASPQREELRKELRIYAKAVSEEEWALLESGRASLTAQSSFENLFPICTSIRPKDLHDQVIMQVFLERLNRLGDLRRTRLMESHEAMPPMLWWALLVGAAVTIAFTFFFGSRNPRAMSMMTGMLAGLIALLLFVIHEIDHPYRGASQIEPKAMQSVLMRIEELDRRRPDATD